jgi:acetolactate synthase-1/2/3 large subunit
MAMESGGHLVARALKAEGISHLFTLCGGHIQNIYDGCLDYGIRVVDTRHEQSAAHAADGWARVTGRPGVAAVTAGPGVTDAVTAVANAQRAQVPMLLIGGAGPKGLADKGSLQDMDHVSLMRSITKWSVSVPDGSRLPEYVQNAFRIATTGTPGRCSWRCRSICCSCPWTTRWSRSTPSTAPSPAPPAIRARWSAWPR